MRNSLEYIDMQNTQDRIAREPVDQFRALYMRRAEAQGRFPMAIEHALDDHGTAGTHEWLLPDVVLVEWEGGQVGEEPVRFTSVQVGGAVTRETVREHFFRCLSNSRWAQRAELAIAARISDAAVVSELRALGNAYGVAVTCFGMDDAMMAALPDAEEILSMPEGEVDALLRRCSVTPLSAGRPRSEIDSEHFHAMVARSVQFADLLGWVSRCLNELTAYPYATFDALRRVEVITS